MGSYQVIFFDAAQTLFHINGSVAEIYLQYAVRHGFRQTPTSIESIKQAFSRAFKDASPPVFAPTEPAFLVSQKNSMRPGSRSVPSPLREHSRVP